jgi:6-phosphofructokinase 1
MGRDTGWVAVMGGLAGGADMIIIPEFEITVDEVVSHVHARRAAGSDFSIIVVSEGVRMDGLGDDGESGGPRDAFGHVQLSRRGVGERLADLIEQRTQLETRATVLGHTQRGGTPSAFDRIWATHVGVAAYDLLVAQAWGRMPVVQCGEVRTAAIADVVAQQRRVPEELYRLAQVFY